jgi:ubiquinone/menaquinone biosynthesis C-methylase UbiE
MNVGREDIRSGELAPSEAHGVFGIPRKAERIYSVGVSVGAAEMRMAKMRATRTIIATTISQDRANLAHQNIAHQNLGEQVVVKTEDVSQPLPYEDNYFDYIYARLVLHYLDRQQLGGALGSLYRVLQPTGQLYVVVRSQDCWDYDDPSAYHDPISGLTSYTPKTVIESSMIHRFFHSQTSIAAAVEQAGFDISSISQYDEQLFADNARQVPAETVDNLIEVMAYK